MSVQWTPLFSAWIIYECIGASILQTHCSTFVQMFSLCTDWWSENFLAGESRKRFLAMWECTDDRLCGLVVSVPGHRFRGASSIPGATRFSRVMGLERDQLSLLNAIMELLEKKSSGFGLKNWDYGRRWSAELCMRRPSISKSWH
jgi:hypothetical protein